MILQIDLESPVPPYEQVREQIAALAEAGVVAVGDRLPSIRQLAGDLGVATNTVQRAYSELERQGVIQARGRHGTVVLGPPDRTTTDSRRALALRLAADQLAQEAMAAGSGLDEVVQAARVAFLRAGNQQRLAGGESS